MSGWWSRAPIRVRLTTWYVAVLTLLLVLYATVTYLAVRHEFREQLEEAEAIHGADPVGEEHLGQQLREILVVLILGLPIVVALAGIGGYALARRALAPIDHLAAEAKRITADRLHERLTVPNQTDEIGRLAAVINDAFARIEASFEQLKRFTSDASHELRTPLAVVRGIGESNLREPRGAAAYRDAFSSILEEVDRLTRLVDTLLRLSRADAGTMPLSPERVNLGQLTRDVVTSMAVLAEERRQRLHLDLDGDVCARCDPSVLREAVVNLLDNAIKYSPRGSAVTVRVAQSNGRARVSISDEGPGIAVEHRSRVFDRFYRIDEGRSREAGGTGLGLAIAKSAVDANGGHISLEPGDRGVTFVIDLPAEPLA